MGVKRWVEFLAMALLVVLADCASPKNIRLTGYRRIGVSTTNFDSTTIRLELICFNPNRIGVTVKEGWMNVYSGTQLLGKLMQESAVRVRARDTFYFPMQMSVSMAYLFQYSSKLKFGDSILLTGSGNCRIGKEGVYVSHQLQMKQMVQLKLF